MCARGRRCVGELLISMDTGVQEQELAVVNRMLYEQGNGAGSLFGQAGEAALPAAHIALQARTRQAELRASIASAQTRAAADGVVGGDLRGRRRVSPARAAFWGPFMEPGCGSSPPDARRNWQT